MGGVKDKIMSLFKINTTQDHNKPLSGKNLHGGAKKPWKLKKKQTEDNTIKNVRNIFRL